ncbi:MAG: chromate transporter [Treponema sp.]|jgi:chromate transporter|nr:chromate transporter [Treponema sp.]
MKEYLELIWVFIKIGVTTFGGGYAMLPVLDRELIRKKGWIDMDEVMDYYTIAQVTPGIIAVNVSTFVGYKRKGFFGGALATIAFVLPGVILMTIIGIFIQRFAEYPAVQHAFAGIRVAVGALILETVLKLCKGVFKDLRGVIIFVIAFVLSAIFSTSPVFIILGAGFAGFFLFRPPKPSAAAESADRDRPADTGKGADKGGAS